MAKAAGASAEGLEKPVLSLVDEELFGADSRPDAGINADGRVRRLFEHCQGLGIGYEFYTRLDQIMDRKKGYAWNVERARLLARYAPDMRRVFVGVESGSESQLRRYGKGQTVTQTIDGLRVASILGLPIEFGFITFDPLLSVRELVDDLHFLARSDVMFDSQAVPVMDRVTAVERYVGSSATPDGLSGVPLYLHTSYLTTEVVLLAGSRYARSLARNRPDLLIGEATPSTGRYGYRYDDPEIGQIAGWCRTWSDAMFTPIYDARLRVRAARIGKDVGRYREKVIRYRLATFDLLVGLVELVCPAMRNELPGRLYEVSIGDGVESFMAQLSTIVNGES